MGCIIIVMRKIEDARKVGALLGKRGFRPDLLCTSAAEALSESSRRESGFIICGSRLPDMGFLEFRDCLPGAFRLVILSKNIMSDDYPSDAVKLSLPLKIVDLTAVLVKELTVFGNPGKEKQSPRSTRSIEEKRYIDRAKLLLMEKKGMSEPDAYRYIQKSSMDNSYSMVETAQMIILMNN